MSGKPALVFDTGRKEVPMFLWQLLFALGAAFLVSAIFIGGFRRTGPVDRDMDFRPGPFPGVLGGRPVDLPVRTGAVRGVLAAVHLRRGDIRPPAGRGASRASAPNAGRSVRAGRGEARRQASLRRLFLDSSDRAPARRDQRILLASLGTGGVNNFPFWIP